MTVNLHHCNYLGKQDAVGEQPSTAASTSLPLFTAEKSLLCQHLEDKGQQPTHSVYYHPKEI